jgi:hypothetical protein
MRFKPKPLPPDANWLDRLEWALEWLLSRVIFRSDRYPLLSGMLTVLLLFPAVLIVATLVGGALWLLAHLKPYTGFQLG